MILQAISSVMGGVRPVPGTAYSFLAFQHGDFI
jgi:hypothetical protein